MNFKSHEEDVYRTCIEFQSHGEDVISSYHYKLLRLGYPISAFVCLILNKNVSSLPREDGVS